MMRFNSVEELLVFAIGKEDESNQFYKWMSAKASKREMKEMFAAVALEELAHRAKIEAIRDGKLPLVLVPAVQDLQMEKYLCDVPASPDISYREGLILAMKREKAAYRLYSDLSAITSEPGLQLAMLGLAQEEARHKLQFEVEFDENILMEN